MPQLETASYISQIFWLIISFIGLWGAMSLFIVPKIEDILEQRRLKIDDYVQKAEELQKEALQSLEKYEKQIAKAREDATKKLIKSKELLHKNVVEKRAEIGEEIALKIAENQKNIELKQKEILAHVDRLSLRLCAEILKKTEIGEPKPQELQKYMALEEQNDANFK